MIPGVPTSFVNHLWQSTVFVAMVWLVVTLMLRRHDARVRYWLWVAASVKFLVPFSWLVSAGAQLEWRRAPVGVPTAASFVIEQVLTPSVLRVPVVSAQQPRLLSSILIGVWVVGCVAVLLAWWRQWTPIRSAVRNAMPLRLDSLYDGLGLTLMSSQSTFEPGLVGIWRPVLLVPDGLLERLTPAQMKAVLAHEQSHVRYRDNLVAALHMAVEAVFWFHPLVWWIGKRLIDERERACDDDVLRSGHQPADFAEGILVVCRHTVRTSLACVAGVSGSDLRRRIESIMACDTSRRLGLLQKVLLVVAAMSAVVGPTIAGVLAVPARVQAGQTAQRAQFEAASIRRTAEGVTGITFVSSPGGRLHVVNNPVMNLITNAYSIPPYRVSRAPSWVSSDRYDVEATAGRDVSGSEVMQMLQALLEDRFKLKAHRELRDGPIYVLKVARSGAKVEKSKDGVCVSTDPRNPLPPNQPRLVECGSNLMSSRGPVIVWHGTRIDMAGAASALSRHVRRPVVDQTGLSGFFDVNVELPGIQPEVAAGADLDPAAAESVPSLFTVLRERLGLTLESAKGPVETLVIDRIERPTDN